MTKMIVAKKEEELKVETEVKLNTTECEYILLENNNKDKTCHVVMPTNDDNEIRKDIQLKKSELLTAMMKTNASSAPSCCLRTFIFLLCFLYVFSFTCFIFSPFVTFERTHSRNSTTDIYNVSLQLTPSDTSMNNISFWNYDSLPINESLSKDLIDSDPRNILEIMANINKIANKFLQDQENQNQLTSFSDNDNLDLKTGSRELITSGDFSGDFGDNKIETTKNGKSRLIADLSQIENTVFEMMMKCVELSKHLKGGAISLTRTKEGLYDHEFITLHIGFNEMGTWEIILRFGIVVLGMVPFVITRKLFW